MVALSVARKAQIWRRVVRNGIRASFPPEWVKMEVEVSTKSSNLAEWLVANGLDPESRLDSIRLFVAKVYNENGVVRGWQILIQARQHAWVDEKGRWVAIRNHKVQHGLVIVPLKVWPSNVIRPQDWDRLKLIPSD